MFYLIYGNLRGTLPRKMIVSYQDGREEAGVGLGEVGGRDEHTTCKYGNITVNPINLYNE